MVIHCQMKGNPQGWQGLRWVCLKTVELEFGHESDHQSLKVVPDKIHDPSSLLLNLLQVGEHPACCQEYSLVEVILGVANVVQLVGM